MRETQSVRKIVHIDPDKCDGCGACVPSCAEGAIQIIGGKARLKADNLCDGLGNCLGECPRGAITIEERPAEEFDENAGRAHLRADVSAPTATAGAKEGRPSQLAQWPVQLALVPTAGPMWQDADVLISADCVPFALAGFHEQLLAGKTLAIACPKLDDTGPYVEKLAAIFSRNSIRSITVAHMEVPCCTGIVYAVREALDRAGRADIPLHDVTVGIEGGILEPGGATAGRTAL